MPDDWSDKTTCRLLNQGLIQKGICLLLGAADTGKTTLAAAIARHTASCRPVAIIDADVGQSHIGPPTTVGWTVVDNPPADLSQLTAAGISFVGDVTPAGHLLQLTAAIAQCVRQASEAADLIIIDTPGLIHGPAAAALWWTTQRILQPQLILAVQRNDELTDILAGLKSANLQRLESPPQIPAKSPQQRRNYRQNRFKSYFQNSQLYNIKITDIAVQTTRNLNRNSPVHRLIALRNARDLDLAIGIITDWQTDKDTVTVKAPQLDIRQVRCIVIGDVSINTSDMSDYGYRFH